MYLFFFFFSSRRRHTRSLCDWSSDVCSSDLPLELLGELVLVHLYRMNDADWFGRYGESAVQIPVRHPGSGTEGAYSPLLFVESDGAVAAGREIYGQPKKSGTIEIAADGD